MNVLKKHLDQLVLFGSNIENIKIKLGETRELMDNLNSKKVKEWDYLTIMNLYKVYKYVIEGAIIINNNFPVSNYLEIHKIIGENIVENPGQLRKKEVRVYGANFVPLPVSYEYLNQILINSLCNPSVERILKLMIDLMKLQPFNDANKRTALVWCNLMLSKYHNKLLIIGENHVDEFIDLLILYYDDNIHAETLIVFLNKFLISE